MKKCECIIDRHAKYLGNIFSFELDTQGLVVVPRAATCLTLDEYVGEEVHLDLFGAASFAHFASPTTSVERESSGSESALLCVECRSKYLTNVGEHARICGDVGVWGFSDG